MDARTPAAPVPASQSGSALPASAAETAALPPSGPGYLPSVIPHDLLAGCAAAHRRLINSIAALDDQIARRPSLLRHWTVGHLLTHLARNADSHAEMVEAAGRGEVRAQYPGGQAQRDAEIEAGAGRPAGILVDDLRSAVTRLEQAWDGTHVDVWRTGLGHTVSCGRVTLPDLVFYRWREVEIHLVDLGLADLGGSGWESLSPGYVHVEWERTLSGLPARIPAEITLLLAPGDRPSRALGTGSDLVMIEVPTLPALRWLTGRGGDASWPVLGPWL